MELGSLKTNNWTMFSNFENFTPRMKSAVYPETISREKQPITLIKQYNTPNLDRHSAMKLGS